MRVIKVKKDTMIRDIYTKHRKSIKLKKSKYEGIIEMQRGK